MSSKTSSSKSHNSHKFSNSQKAGDNNSRSKGSSSSNNNNNKDNSCKVPNKNPGNTNDDAKPASVMSNLSSYSMIDDDHIDDQETINVGNLIIDLESDLEKEKIENEQANAKTAPKCTTTNASSSTSSNLIGLRASSSINTGASSTLGGKINQKSSKHSNNANSSSNSTGNFSGSNSNSTATVDGKNGHGPNPRTVFKTSADERGELKMRITRETKPGKSEHKIVTSPNQKSPTSSSSNINSNLNVNNQANCEDFYMHDLSSDPTQSSISSTRECGTSTSIGTITEPDCLGPCEPGTSVNLEGIVWQETEGGILVVNVTWRGKTYVGALLDCTKHDWAPPRLCDSPASDIDSKTHKGVRTKRIVTRSNGIGLDEKNLLQTTGKLRNGKGRRILPNDSTASGTKKQKELDKSNENVASLTEANSSLTGTPSLTNSETACVPMNIDTSQVTNNETISTSELLEKAGPNSPTLIGCKEPNCSKKYRNINGLMYHQSHAHPTDQESSNPMDDNCSSPKEKGKGTNVLDQEPGSADDEMEHHSPEIVDVKQNQALKQLPAPETRGTPSPQLRSSHKLTSGPPIDGSAHMPIASEQRSNKNGDSERRHLMNPNHDSIHNIHSGHKSPGPSRQQQQSHDQGSSSNNHSAHPSKFGSSSGGGGGAGSSGAKPMNQASAPPAQPPPLPATSEEGMKPSGTSTGPPPAPHQANCYFNSAFLNNTFNPYSLPPYFPRQMYDPLTAPTPVSSSAFLNRFMSNVRVPPPPESPSRLLSPSTLAKGLPPFPPFPKMDPSSMPPLNPMPGASQLPNPPLPGMPPMINPHLPGGSAHLRMPSQGDPLLPPTPQSPFLPPAGLNPALGSSPVFREHFPRN